MRSSISQTTTEAQRDRALQALAELSAILGAPAVPHKQQQQQPLDAALARVSQTHQQKKEPIPEPLMSCPPYSDPSSVVIIEQETLEYELVGAEDSRSATTTTSSLPPRTTTKVQFSNFVSVIEIPSHRDMDPLIIDCIWTSVEEIQHNAQRNTMEWRWDGKDWTNATEEEAMMYGYIHPATWEAMKMYEEEQRFLREAKEKEMERWRSYMTEFSLKPASLGKKRRATVPKVCSSSQWADTNPTKGHCRNRNAALIDSAFESLCCTTETGNDAKEKKQKRIATAKHRRSVTRQDGSLFRFAET